jgi:hypothetical protein
MGASALSQQIDSNIHHDTAPFVCSCSPHSGGSMIYLKETAELPAIIILEPSHLKLLRDKVAIKTIDQKILIFFTPDAKWLNDALIESDGSVEQIFARIYQSQERPEVADPGPYFPPIISYFNSNQEQGEDRQ